MKTYRYFSKNGLVTVTLDTVSDSSYLIATISNGSRKKEFTVPPNITEAELKYLITLLF